MNDHDRNNLDFLLYSTESQLKEWYASSTADDRDYAHELMMAKADELREQSKALFIEAQLAKMSEYPDARRVIDRVRV
jgi:hypothetical protein